MIILIKSLRLKYGTNASSFFARNVGLLSHGLTPIVVLLILLALKEIAVFKQWCCRVRRPVIDEPDHIFIVSRIHPVQLAFVDRVCSHRRIVFNRRVTYATLCLRWRPLHMHLLIRIID